jgi:hypothetical protein
VRFKGLSVRVASLFIASCLFTNVVQASLIDIDSYSNDVNNEMYWTNNNLSLDVMRLSYSDLLNTDGTSSGGKASLTTIDTWLDTQTEWRWSNYSDFVNINNWFDTDNNKKGWSEAQNLGGTLFFELNGVGSAYGKNNLGYRYDGYSEWMLLTKRYGYKSLRFAQIKDYCDTVVACKLGSSSVGTLAYHSTKLSSMDASILTRSDVNAAALLVRNSTTNVEVPEPSTAAIFALGLIGLTSRRLKKKN